MVKACKLEAGNLDRHAAWKKYGRMVERAMSEGQIWRPDIVRKIYPIVLQLLDESELICLTELYEEAKDEAQRRRRELKRKVKELGR